MSNYIYDYYQRIKDGSEPVGKWIRLWYEYIVNGLKNKEFFYEPKKAYKAIMFIENYCHHHEGDLAPQLIQLELWQKAFVSVIFGILDKNGNRQFREVVLIVGRKCGKTLLASAIAEYVMFCDGEYGARVYFCAPKLEQARLCYDAFCQMITKEPELESLVKKRRTDIYFESYNTSAQPLAFNAKKSDGLNPHLVVCDEFSAWSGDQGRKQYEVLKSALGARKQPLILSISTANYVDGVYDELMKRSTAVINGTSKEKRLAPFIYQIDDQSKWDDINELKKSMPNLNVSVSVDYMLEEIAIAQNSLSKKSEFLTKYCNVRQNSSLAWLDSKTIVKSTSESFTLDDFRKHYCVGGIDLSRTTDLTACCIVIEKNEKLYVISKFFLPREKIEDATARDGLPYRAYIQRGFLMESGENFIDYEDCFQWFKMLVEQYQIYPLKIGYDRYNSLYLTQCMQNYGFHMDDVYQGFNLSTIIDMTEGMMKDGNIQIGDNDLLKAHLFDSALKYDTTTGRKRLVKLSNFSHVDGTASLLDAMTVRTKWYSEIGDRLKNGG